MTADRAKSKPKRKRVNFKFFSPEAGSVCVAGDFNNWHEQKHPMVKKDDGYWHKTLVLKPATYEYKFKVDGGWQIDPDNPFSCPNEFGTKNNFILVE